MGCNKQVERVCSPVAVEAMHRMLQAGWRMAAGRIQKPCQEVLHIHAHVNDIFVMTSLKHPFAKMSQMPCKITTTKSSKHSAVMEGAFCEYLSQGQPARSAQRQHYCIAGSLLCSRQQVCTCPSCESTLQEPAAIRN